jgi:Putative nuclear localisation signal of quaking
MHDVVHKAQRVVTADRARCRLDRIDTATGAPLALAGQRGHHARAPKSVAGSRSATQDHFSLRPEPASPVPGTTGATGRWSSGAGRA